MIELKQMRRSFLLGLAGLGISQTLPQGQTAARAAAPQGYVLGPDGGDHLVHFRNPGNIFIKVDPTGPYRRGHPDPQTLRDGRSLLRSGRRRDIHAG
jgi:hypothetical protein